MPASEVREVGPAGVYLSTVRAGRLGGCLWATRVRRVKRKKSGAKKGYCKLLHATTVREPLLCVTYSKRGKYSREGMSCTVTRKILGDTLYDNAPP